MTGLTKTILVIVLLSGVALAVCAAVQHDASGSARGVTGLATNVSSAEPSGSQDGWQLAEPGYQYQFPRDHSSHPDYRIEWWYYTGNVTAPDGRQFGYQLTFFRTGVVRNPENPSRWTVRDLYMAHFAISDISGRGFHYFERLNRAGIGWAGASTDEYRVWNQDWKVTLGGRDHLLAARDGNYSINFRLTSEKPEVIHGEDGISRKGAAAGNASHYYSITRLRTTGILQVDGKNFQVEGSSWMDHEFSSSFLEPGQAGWDWFSIQLDDGRDLMLWQIRHTDGSIDPYSSGTLVDASGRATHISHDQFTLKPLNVWRSQVSEAAYPVEWSVTIPAYGLDLRVKAAMPNQELRTGQSTGITYWEGSIDVAGSAPDTTSANLSQTRSKITGRGYLEMTGYTGSSLGSFLR